MVLQRGDNDIVTQLCNMNHRMNRIANKFGDKLDRLEKQRVNDHDNVQIRHEQREFNVKRVVRQVNTNMDEFVADNTDMISVDFKDVSVKHEECFGHRERYSNNFGQRGNYGYRDHNSKLG